MPLDVATLRTTVNAGTQHDAVLGEIVQLATALLDRYVDDTLMDTADPVPAVVYDQALLAVAVEAWNQRQSVNGYLFEQGLDADSAVPVRVGTDPFRPARALLAHWCLDMAVG